MPEPIKFTLSLRQRALYLILAVICVLAGSFSWVFYAVAVGLVIGFLLLGFTGVTLSADGITIQSLTRKRIPWGTVQQVENTILGTTRTVTVHYDAGKKVRLRAPMTSLAAPDDEFDAKVDTIRRYWAGHSAGEPTIAAQ